MSNVKVKLHHRVDFDLLSDDSIIVDAGVCKGEFVKFIRSNGINCRIIGFEPCRSNMENLRTMDLGNTELYELALVGLNTGVAKFNEYKNHPGWGSILPRHTDGPLIKRLGKLVTSYDVELISINEVFNRFNIDKIDFLKLDVEGAEYGIINNISMDTAYKINQISIELHELPNIERNVNKLAKNVINLLEALGFECEYFKSECEVWCTKK